MGMAQILVRNLDENVVARLKDRAKKDGRSLQSELKFILKQAAALDMNTAQEILEDYRRRFKGKQFSDSAELIRENRNR